MGHRLGERRGPRRPGAQKRGAQADEPRVQRFREKSKEKDAVEARQGHSSCRWDWRRLHRRAFSALRLFHCTLTGLGVTVRCSEWEGRPMAGGRVTDGSSGWPILDGLDAAHVTIGPMIQKK